MDFKDISWLVTEEEYRKDPALSYSTLAKYERSGFNDLDKLFDRVESPSLTFGSCVDSIITGGMEEFNERFEVMDFPEISDTIIKIIKYLFEKYKDTYNELEAVPDSGIEDAVNVFNYQPRWRIKTRIDDIRNKGSEYYKLLYIAGEKTIISCETYNDVNNAVEALKNSEATKWYFSIDNPFENVKRYYQLKFKGTINNMDFRCMADEIIVDYDKKIVYPIDLKTSSHYEWDFYKSFIDWDYQIQARLYWRLIYQNMQKYDEFKDFKLANYTFIVVNRKTLTPLTWEFSRTMDTGDIELGANGNIVMRDPVNIAEELTYYLNQKPKVPLGIILEGKNSLTEWIETM